jgi:hypothetical protein
MGKEKLKRKDDTGSTRDLRLHLPTCKKQKCFLDEKELMYILKHGYEIKLLVHIYLLISLHLCFVWV